MYVPSLEQFRPSCGTTTTTLVFSCFELFMMPWIFQLVWNDNIPDLFELPSITYVQALLLKLMYDLFFKSGCSVYCFYAEQHERTHYYVNALYQKLHNKSDGNNLV